MIYLFSFSCDLGFLSVTNEDVEVSKLCSKYYTQLFLLIWISNNSVLFFRDSCMGIIKNEQSKINLKQSLSQKTILCSILIHMHGLRK